MMQFIIDNKEVLSFSVSILGILLSLAFGGILGWRHKICLDYESHRTVAINILHDNYIQRINILYSEVANQSQSQQESLIRDLARYLEDQNRVKRLFRWLALASQIAFGLIWFSIIFVLTGILSIWFTPPFFLIVLWSIVLGALLLGFIASVSAMWILDGRFFHLVHRIIKPEGE